MTDFIVDVASDASPAAVLDAIRTHAGYWEESLVPPALRDRGVFGVKVTVRGNEFELIADDMGRDPPAIPSPPLWRRVAYAVGGRSGAGLHYQAGHSAFCDSSVRGRSRALCGVWEVAVCSPVCRSRSFFGLVNQAQQGD